MPQAETPPLKALRGFLLLLFLIGSLGVGAELLLLEHYEDYWQWTPLVLVGLSLAVLAWCALAPDRTSLRAFQGMMGLLVISGFVGLWLHYQGNVEFEQEMYPTLKGLELFWEALKGATPALAPGTMIQLGLLGLAFTYRHPAFTHSAEPALNPNEKSP